MISAKATSRTKPAKSRRRSAAARSRRAFVRPVAISQDEPDFQIRLAQALEQSAKNSQPLVEEYRASERLSDRDFSIRINTRG